MGPMSDKYAITSSRVKGHMSVVYEVVKKITGSATKTLAILKTFSWLSEVGEPTKAFGSWRTDEDASLHLHCPFHPYFPF
jgi:hypothetical protein